MTHNKDIIILVHQILTIKEEDKFDVKIDSHLLNNPIFDFKVIAPQAIKENRIWDVNKDTLISFLLKNTHWDPLCESFSSYYKNQPIGHLSEILFIFDGILESDKQHFKDYIQV